MKQIATLQENVFEGQVLNNYWTHFQACQILKIII